MSRGTATRSIGLMAAIAAICLVSMLPAAAARPAPGPLARGIVDIRTRLGLERYAVAGTGIVLSGRGEILTNNHVIRGATSIRVRDVVHDRSYAARVVGYDVAADVAVLQLAHASGLESVLIGNSARLRKGDVVTAVGNALGAGGAPRSESGKIVALHRGFLEVFEDGVIQPLRDLIQVDAALFPGDSGGPLFDSAGRVIGIDTLGSFTHGLKPLELTGAGAAIPIDTATSIARAIEAGRSSRTIHVGPTAFLGLDFEFSGVYSGLTPGVTVLRVVPRSPAARAGLSPGDVVSSFDGAPVAGAADIAASLFGKSPGAQITLGWTDVTGNARSATVTLLSGPAL